MTGNNTTAKRCPFCGSEAELKRHFSAKSLDEELTHEKLDAKCSKPTCALRYVVMSLEEWNERTTVTVSTVVETHITVCIHGVNIGIPCKDCELKSDTEFGHLYKSREGENQLKGLLELSNDDIVKSAKINPEGVVEVLMDEINDLQSALRDLRQKQPTIPQDNAEELIRDIRHADSQGADDILMPRVLELCTHYEALRQKMETREPLTLSEVDAALKLFDSQPQWIDKSEPLITAGKILAAAIREKTKSPLKTIECFDLSDEVTRALEQSDYWKKNEPAYGDLVHATCDLLADEVKRLYARLTGRTEELTKARDAIKGKLSLEEIESIPSFFALKTLDPQDSISDKALKNIGIAQAILREIRTKFASLTTNEAESTEFKK